MATFNIDVTGSPDFGSEELRKFLHSMAGCPAPRVSNNIDNVKYVFNITSKAVFLGSRYIGQGELKGNTLFVTQYISINSHPNNFSATPINLN